MIKQLLKGKKIVWQGMSYLILEKTKDELRIENVITGERQSISANTKFDVMPTQKDELLAKLASKKTVIERQIRDYESRITVLKKEIEEIMAAEIKPLNEEIVQKENFIQGKSIELKNIETKLSEVSQNESSKS